jgi:hypothetical protein
MAKAGRLDGVVVGGNGSVTIKMTHGEAPLPASWQGESMVFASKSEFVDAMEEIESRISGQDLALIQAASAYKADPSMKATFVLKCTDKEARIDLTGDVKVITVEG